MHPAVPMTAHFVAVLLHPLNQMGALRQGGGCGGDGAGKTVFAKQGRDAWRTRAQSVLVVALVAIVADGNFQCHAEFIHRFGQLVATGDALF